MPSGVTGKNACIDTESDKHASKTVS